MLNDKSRKSPQEAQACLDQEAMVLEHDEPAVPGLLAWVEELLDAGASPAALTIPVWRGQTDGKKTSALVLAAGVGCEAMVESFLKKEPLGVHVADDEGDNALLSALKARKSSVAQLLIPLSNLAARDGHGRSCLWTAIRSDLASEAAAIVERMAAQDREREFGEMLAATLAGKSSAQGALWKTIQALLLSKIEQGALAQAASSLSAAAQPSRARL